MKAEKFDDLRESIMHYHQTHGIVETPELDTLVTLSFNQGTKWTDDTLPKKILEYGKVPPLGIKALHKKGLNGNGINVAIIDQPLALDHPEYRGKIAEYRTFGPEGYNFKISSMHGPAVTSLLVGENLGTAPKAKVYYAATPTWLKDAQYESQALKWLIDLNKTLPAQKRIKFVSVSAAPGDPTMRNKASTELWLKTVQEAEKADMCVVECTDGNRFVNGGYIDYQTKQFKYGFPKYPYLRPVIGSVHVPNSLRTVAESYDNQHFSYSFDGNAGLSWGIPYAVGVLCIGQQINPALSASKLKNLLIETAATNNCIIAPEKFVEAVKATCAYKKPEQDLYI